MVGQVTALQKLIVGSNWPTAFIIRGQIFLVSFFHYCDIKTPEAETSGIRYSYLMVSTKASALILRLSRTSVATNSSIYPG